MITITTDFKNLAADVQAEAERYPVAASRALNAAARGLKTDTGRELRKRYPRLKLKDVSGLIDILFSNVTNLAAVVSIKGRPLSLLRFKVGVITDRGRGGVWVDVKGTRKFIAHAWVQNLKNKSGDDYQVIFIREGKGRLPVKVLKTVDLPSAANILEVRQQLDALVQSRFDVEFDRQLTRLSA